MESFDATISKFDSDVLFGSRSISQLRMYNAHDTCVFTLVSRLVVAMKEVLSLFFDIDECGFAHSGFCWSEAGACSVRKS